MGSKHETKINISMLKGGECFVKKNIKQSKGIGSAGEWIAVSNSKVGFMENVRTEQT